MIFDGPPPAFIIMIYILALTASTFGLLQAIEWLNVNITLIGRVTMRNLGLAFFTADYFLAVLAVINIMIGANSHALDKVILSILLPLHVYPVIVLVWVWRRFQTSAV